MIKPPKTSFAKISARVPHCGNVTLFSKLYRWGSKSTTIERLTKVSFRICDDQ
jgi:hypothetical protein